jgi:hypothetical protein
MDLVDNHFGWLIPIWLLKSSFLLVRYRRYTPCIPIESLRKGFPGLLQKEGPDLLERVPLGRSGWGLGGRILFRVDMCGSDNSKRGYGSDRLAPKMTVNRKKDQLLWFPASWMLTRIHDLAQIVDDTDSLDRTWSGMLPLHSAVVPVCLEIKLAQSRCSSYMTSLAFSLGSPVSKLVQKRIDGSSRLETILFFWGVIPFR